MGIVVLNGDDTAIDLYLSDVLAAPVRQTIIPHYTIDTTATKMRELVLAGIADLRANELATMIIRDIPGRDFDAIARRMYAWIKSKVKYVRDPATMEQIRDWRATLKRGAGDCDDFAIIAATLLGTLGIKTRIKIVQSGIKVWNHVYIEYFSPTKGRWVPFDASQDRQVGWEPAVIHKAKLINI